MYVLKERDPAIFCGIRSRLPERSRPYNRGRVSVGYGQDTYIHTYALQSGAICQYPLVDIINNVPWHHAVSSTHKPIHGSPWSWEFMIYISCPRTYVPHWRCKLRRPLKTSILFIEPRPVIRTFPPWMRHWALAKIYMFGSLLLPLHGRSRAHLHLTRAQSLGYIMYPSYFPNNLSLSWSSLPSSSTSSPDFGEDTYLLLVRCIPHGLGKFIITETFR